MKLSFRILIFTFLFFWCAGIFLPFYFHLFDPLLKLYPILKLSYSHVCHQIDYKLFLFGSKNTLVCARCTGIYTGLFISSFLFLFTNHQIKISTKFLFIFAIPTFLDIVFYSVKIYDYSQLAAGLSGLLIGTTGFFYILGSVKIWFLENKLEKEF